MRYVDRKRFRVTFLKDEYYLEILFVHLEFSMKIIKNLILRTNFYKVSRYDQYKGFITGFSNQPGNECRCLAYDDAQYSNWFIFFILFR